MWPASCVPHESMGVQSRVVLMTPYAVKVIPESGGRQDSGQATVDE